MTIHYRLRRCLRHPVDDIYIYIRIVMVPSRQELTMHCRDDGRVGGGYDSFTKSERCLHRRPLRPAFHPRVATTTLLLDRRVWA